MGKVIGFSNFADTIISYFKNEATAQRTYTFPDEDVDFSPVAYSTGTWTPVFTGFSVDPSNYTARYVKVGKMCFATFVASTNGTSNAVTFTMTLPFTSANSGRDQYTILSTVVDNGSLTTTPGKMLISANSNVATLTKDLSGASWTSSGGKRAFFSIVYETES